MKMKDKDFCPECGIGLNSQEIHMRFCQNCKAHWEEDVIWEDDDEEPESMSCNICGLTDDHSLECPRQNIPPKCHCKTRKKWTTVRLIVKNK